MPCEAENAGEVFANSGTIEVISTPLGGWNTVTNALDAVEGIEADTDTLLRLRREERLRATGSTTVDAIRADLLSFQDADGSFPILQASVFENVTDLVDANGLPKKSIECVILDNATLTADQIAQIIWDTKGGGVLAFGQLSGNAADSLGGVHVVGYSVPATREVYLELDLDINQNTGYEGQAAVKTALVEMNDTDLLIGRDVIANKTSSIAQAFDGVIDVTATRLGFSVIPAGTVNLVISTRQQARLDTSRIVITENLIPVP